MKITLNAQKLRETLNIASRSAASKGTMLILSCVLLQADKKAQRLYISSTNLDFGIRTSMPAEVESESGVALNAGLLNAIVSNLAGDTVTITRTKDAAQTIVKSGTSTFRLNSINEDEFPPVRPDEGVTALEFTQADLLQKLTAIASCASKDATRYILNGVYIVNRAGMRMIVATDGRRMHLIEEAGVAGVEASAILPNASIQKILTMLKHGEKVRMFLGDKSASFRIDREDGEIHVRTKIVEGSYPNYRQVIPTRSTFLKMEREVLGSAIARVAMVTSDKGGSVTMNIVATDLTLSAASPDLGEAKESLTVANNQNMEGKVAFSPQLMLEAIDAAGGEHIDFSLDPKASDASPIFIRSGSFSAVVMPVRLS